MIDRPRRDRYVELIRQFVAGRITNVQYEKIFEHEVMDHTEGEGLDPILWEMFDAVWQFYDDVRTHRLRDSWALSEEESRCVAKWILFLHSDREFEAPPYKALLPEQPGCLYPFFGLTRRPDPLSPEQQAELDLWPYTRREDLEEDRKSPVLLAGPRSAQAHD